MTGRRLLLPIFLLVAIPAAAQTNPAGVAAGVFGGSAPRFIPTSLWQRMLERPEDAPDPLTLTVPRDSAWNAVESVLKGFDLPITFSDPASGQMGSVKSKLYKRMGKQAISEFLRCGEGTAGANADMYVVYVTAVAIVTDGGNGNQTIGVLLTGQAVDLPNGRSDPVDCTSSGRFENRFTKELVKRLGVLAVSNQ